ncbi:hypothetical protein AKJ62_00820 [candidate division MSBL1 archaeon SCGC-AAA259D14]|uniref:Steroid 5-alpha reductase C-terminal domain-containing protein n=1 Tax=candidate division MSBL1 archaeon SCGC-AAA259D14 TaxID=1698261 RepID=A0A133U8G7_9EURY|nr:hypothetical protein AKJ62_00820 [candidate division MSBL1 archaeon SCGC-AAA259D14]
MFGYFFACITGFFLMMILHLWSVEHRKLKQRFGEDKGIKIGKILGAVSGWMELVFLIGFWTSPQPRFTLFSNSSVLLPFVGLSIPLFHLITAIPLMIAGAWVAIKAVKEMSGEVGFVVVDAHSVPEKVVKSGPYTIVRHPQYLGANLAHIGGSILFSASYALLFTPIYVMCNYLISWKEEEELVKELGREYKEYQENTPMFVPKIWKKRKVCGKDLTKFGPRMNKKGSDLTFSWRFSQPVH